MTSAATDLIIEATNVTKSYGPMAAVGGVDIQIGRGEIVGILGPNGAGKTTFIEILEGLRRRDGGEVTVLDTDPDDADGRWRSRIGAVLQLGTETDEFTVAEMLTAHAAYYPASRSFNEIVAPLGLHDLLGRRVRDLSGGQRRLLDIALGVIGEPELLFLDEPTTGLDPEVRRRIWAFVGKLAEAGTTVVLTTHYLEEAEQLADRIIVLVGGEVVARGTPADIKAGSRPSVVAFQLRAPLTSADLPGGLTGRAISGNGTGLRFETADATALVGELMAWADRNDSPIHGLEIHAPNLEESYLRLLEVESATREESQ